MVATKVFPVTTTLPSIFYEDPEPIEDGMQQAQIIIRVTSLLTDYFRDRPDAFVSAGGFIFYDPSNGNRRIAPDIYIAFGVDAPGIWDNLPNYWMWEVGKPPDFALEVASPSTADNDLGHKRELYARLGITEYWRLDPTGGELYGKPLEGERLVDGEYRPYELNTDTDGTTWAYSEVLDLRFHWGLELKNQFDVRDPETRRTIELAEVRQQELLAERAERMAAQDTMLEERSARLAERRAAQDTLREERAAAESRERELLAEIERLRRGLNG